MKTWKTTSERANVMLFEWFIPMRHELKKAYNKRQLFMRKCNESSRRK